MKTQIIVYYLDKNLAEVQHFGVLGERTGLGRDPGQCHWSNASRVLRVNFEFTCLGVKVANHGTILVVQVCDVLSHHHSTHKEVDHTVELRRLPHTWILTVDSAPRLVQVVQTSIFFAEHGQDLLRAGDDAEIWARNTMRD